MIPERTMNIITGSLIVLMMGLICNQLARQFDPQYDLPRLYTNHGYKKLEGEAYKYKMKWREADETLREIAGE